VHVDATAGGFILPFMEQCDYPPIAYDFRVSGVTSISLDLHKYAYCPPSSSAVLYRDQEIFYHQCYTNVGWSGGIYASASISGTRSGLIIALTWATLLYNGRLGYVEKTQRILDTSRILRKRLEEVSCLEVLGEPLGPIIAITSNNSKIPIHALGNEMNELGYSFAFLQSPNALQINISLHQTKGDAVDEIIEDFKRCIESLLTKAEAPIKTNAVFGLTTSLADRGASQFLPSAFVSACYSTPTMLHEDDTRKFVRKRTLSIEGRKLSQLQLPSGKELAALQESLAALQEQAISSPQ